MDPCFIDDAECINEYKTSQAMFYTILGIVVSIFVLAFICIMTGLYVRHRIRERRKDANSVLKKALTREVLQQRIDRAKAKKVNKEIEHIEMKRTYAKKKGNSDAKPEQGVILNKRPSDTQKQKTKKVADQEESTDSIALGDTLGNDKMNESTSYRTVRKILKRSQSKKDHRMFTDLNSDQAADTNNRRDKYFKRTQSSNVSEVLPGLKSSEDLEFTPMAVIQKKMVDDGGEEMSATKFHELFDGLI